MKCILCNSNNTDKYFDEQLNINTFFCNHCKLIFKEPSNFLSPTNEMKRYLLHENEYSEKYANYFNNIINKYIKPYTSLTNGLDFGCGEHAVLSKVFEEQFNVYLDSYDPFFVENKLDKKYDFVVAVEVIEHLNNPIESFDQMFNLLNNDGKLIVITNFYENDYFNWWYRKDPTHIVFYTDDTFKFIAKQYNVNVKIIDNKCAIFSK